jgi:hypothetical protein
MEAVLDTTWAGAVAPGAAVQLVVSKSTNSSDGVLLSMLYAINQNTADILSVSFGACEAANRGAAAGIAALAQQAAAQGISVVVSSGDSGSAGCDAASSPSATGGQSVNVLASNPYTTAVGGTQFNDTDAPLKYWSASNGAGYVSALSYIPETAWNESCAAGSAGCTSPSLWAGGGGASILYPKPSWQSGVAGIPADGKRDLPDVSLTAAGHDPYLVCMLGSCRGSGSFYLVSGTSAAAPAFAGMLALARQNARTRLGLVNTTLYRLAAAQCAAGASACVFNDVTSGTNAVPGAPGYAAGAGYDLATGLGSVNAFNLAGAWNAVTFSPTTTVLNINPKSFTVGSGATVSAAVAPKSGTGKPSGTVSLLGANGQKIASYPLSGGSAVLTESGLPAGSYAVTAHYSGDGAYAPSDSAPVSITVAGAARALLNATAKAFGSVALGSSADGAIVLSNPGGATLSGIVVTIAGTNASDFTRVSGCGATLAAGASCAIGVTFKPSAIGARSATLTVSNSAASTPLAVSLSGTGMAPAPTISAISGQARLGKACTLTVDGANFRTGLTAQVRTPSGIMILSGSALTTVSATQLKIVVNPGGITAYTATLLVQNAGNPQAASRAFPVMR